MEKPDSLRDPEEIGEGEAVSGEELPQSYSESISSLKEVTGRLLRGEIPFNKESVKSLYSHVVEAVGDVLDQAREDVDRNLEFLSKALGPEEAAGADEAVRKVFSIFEETQRGVVEGLTVLGESLAQARSLQDLENGRLKVESALARVTEKLNELELLTLESRELELLKEPGIELPAQITAATELLGRCLESIGRYMESGEREELRACLPLLDEARSSLAEALL